MKLFISKFFHEPSAGFPQFKSKKSSRKSYTTNVVNGNIFLEGKYLKLPKMTAIRIKLYRPISEKFLGIDFAMHGMCVFSTGGRAGYPMFYRNTEKKLAQEQRKLSRCQNWMRG